LEKRFFKTFFRGKFHFFPTYFGGKFSAEFSPKFSPEKNVRKIGPYVDVMITISAIFANFRRKLVFFFKKNNVMINFVAKIAVV
jgi:hypothetical protein